MTKINLWRDSSSPEPLLSPWETFGREIERMMTDMDRMLSPMRSPLLGSSRGSEGSTVSFPVSLEDAEDHYLLSLDMPGVAKEDVSIELLDNQLVITGERKSQETSSAGGLYRNERRFGKFRHAFTLPDNIDTECLEANYENGVLQLSLPKGQETKAKRIEVKEGKGGFLKRLVGRDKEKDKEMESQEVQDTQMQQTGDSQQAS